MSDSEFTWTISNDPVDESSIVITGSATVSYTGMVTIFNQEKLCFSIDLEVGGTVEVTVETASTQYTLIESYEPYEPLDLSELTWEVLPDCGTGTGEILFDAGTNQTPVVWIHVPFIGTQSLNLIEDLIDSTYTVGIEDLYCPIDTLISGIVVPDGTFVANIDSIGPVFNCLNDSIPTNGTQSGYFFGSIDGGFGPFHTEVGGVSEGQATSSPDFGYEGIPSEGTYSVLITDVSGGCQTIAQVLIPEVNAELNLVILSVMPVIEGDCGLIASGAILVQATPSDFSYDLDFEWSPSSGINNLNGAYNQITEAGTYTLILTEQQSACELNVAIEVPEVPCSLMGDLNCDGLVNAADILIFMSYYGTSNGSPCLGNFDQDENCVINTADLLLLLTQFGVASCF